MMKDEKSKNQDMEEKREARRKRRQRNQILAYLVVIALIILVAGGIVYGIHFLTKVAEEREKNQQQQQSVAEDLFQSEGDIAMPTESPEPEEPVIELTYEQKLDQVVNAAIEVMPIEDKVAGLFLVTPESITGVKNVVQAGEGTREALSKYAVGGIVYSASNIKGKEEFQEMLENTELYSKYPVFLAVEEECGSSAQVVSAKLGEKTESAKAIGATGDPANAYQAGTMIGTYLQDLGINMDLAPVADLACVSDSVMEERSFGGDVQTVSDFSLKMLEGLEAQGVTACVKHFPGLGSATTDTSKGLAVTQRTEEEFRENEFRVFRNLIDGGASVIMVSHMSAPGLAGDNIACTLSAHVVTDILRREMEYDGLIITDALNEKAISEYYTSDVAAIMALKAGCDMLLMPEDFELAYNGVLEAVGNGTISEARIDDALRRIYRIKFADRVE